MTHCFCIPSPARGSFSEPEQTSCCWCGKRRTLQFVVAQVDGHGPGRHAHYPVPNPRIEQETCSKRPDPAALEFLDA